MNSPFNFYIHYLDKLSLILSKANETDKDGKLLDMRLAPEMFPLHQQVTTAASFALRAYTAITEEKVEETKLGSVSYPNLINLLVTTKHTLRNSTPDKWGDYKNKKINLVAGFNDCQFLGEEYLTLFSQPNFLFHLNMSYAILRANGIALSKQDYDGFHTYPEHFTFQNNC